MFQSLANQQAIGVYYASKSNFVTKNAPSTSISTKICCITR